MRPTFTKHVKNLQEAGWIELGELKQSSSQNAMTNSPGGTNWHLRMSMSVYKDGKMFMTYGVFSADHLGSTQLYFYRKGGISDQEWSYTNRSAYVYHGGHTYQVNATRSQAPSASLQIHRVSDSSWSISSIHGDTSTYDRNWLSGGQVATSTSRSSFPMTGKGLLTNRLVDAFMAVFGSELRSIRYLPHTATPVSSYSTEQRKAHNKFSVVVKVEEGQVEAARKSMKAFFTPATLRLVNLHTLDGRQVQSSTKSGRTNIHSTAFRAHPIEFDFSADGGIMLLPAGKSIPTKKTARKVAKPTKEIVAKVSMKVSLPSKKPKGVKKVARKVAKKAASPRTQRYDYW